MEQYGMEILSQSMSSPHIGVASLNYVLNQAGIDKDLSQVFADWAVTIVLNDCSAGQEYCFQEEPLNDLKIAPSLIYLPSTQEASLSLVYAIKGWAAHWYKIVGGGKGLKVEFESLSDAGFIVPYFIQHANEVESVSFLELDEDGKGTIELPYFGENHQSLIIVPSVFQKISGFSDKEPFSRFSLDISTFENGQGDEEPIPISEMTVEQLKVRIAEIMAQIRILLAELAKLKAQASDIPSGFSFYRDLGLNSSGSDVRYLQILLNKDSETRLDDYGAGSPGNETSYFGPLTKGAVIRFQNKYSLDLNNGFVGPTTRQKLNSLLDK
ncbi:unnamed protein product [marine sediment metagenome]|uniref:Peptidoglycan binding-like domain-containing protein n=1 Tax=marine sediment metagenome TaxID=412755 RepID=X0T8E9_9ZZZZ